MWDVERIERELLAALSAEDLVAAEPLARQYVASKAPVFEDPTIESSERTPIQKWVNVYMGVPPEVYPGESTESEVGKALGKHLEVAKKLVDWADESDNLDAALLAAQQVTSIDTDRHLEPAVARDGYMHVIGVTLALGDRLDPSNKSDFQRLRLSRAGMAASFFARDPSRQDWAEDARRYANELVVMEFAVAWSQRAEALSTLARVDKKYISDAIDAWNDLRSFVYERYEKDPNGAALFGDGGMFDWTPEVAEYRRASELGGLCLAHGMYKTAASILYPYVLRPQTASRGGARYDIAQNYADALLGQVVTFDRLGNRVVDANAPTLLDKAIATMTSFLEMEQGATEGGADFSVVNEMKSYRTAIIASPAVPLTWEEYRDVLAAREVQQMEEEDRGLDEYRKPAVPVPSVGPDRMGI